MLCAKSRSPRDSCGADREDASDWSLPAGIPCLADDRSDRSRNGGRVVSYCRVERPSTEDQPSGISRSPPMIFFQCGDVLNDFILSLPYFIQTLLYHQAYFIQTLLYGGYNELANILVNLTSLATEMGRLISESYVLTVLAPNDEAMARLTTDQLSEPGSPEDILYYHMIPKYQTEESMCNAVTRFGKVRYDTLRLPHKVMAREADGSVKFGTDDGSTYLFDPDFYTDGRISVQSIDAVLLPPVVDGGGKSAAAATARRALAVTGATAKPRLRRGKFTGKSQPTFHLRFLITRFGTVNFFSRIIPRLLAPP
jgi:uncharacterized surface protein with fasciclin (FAS1) repeats